MRTLRIFRQKAYAASLVSMQVYISDPAGGELQINNVPCRKLGALKNGEEAVFMIPQEACTVFVIGDKLSRNYCNAYYNIPAGNQEVYLTGKNHLDPTTGNPFRFDGAENQAPLPTQQGSGNTVSNTTKSRLIFFGCVALGVIVGILVVKLFMSPKEAEPKTFTNSGISITMTESFEKTSLSGFTVSYDSPTSAMVALKEEFSLAEGLEDLTVEEYGQFFLEANDLDGQSSIIQKDGLNYFEYETEEDGETGYCFGAIFKSHDAFWVVQFATDASLKDSLRPSFIEWAKTVTFPKSV